MFRRKLCLILVVATLALLAACAQPGEDGERGDVDQATTIQVRAPDIPAVVAQTLADAYREIDAGAAALNEISAAGIPALIDGTAGLAFASRGLDGAEKAAARSRGVEPVEHVIGYDALVVYLHHDNPPKSLSMRQLAGIFGEGGKIERWIQLEYDVPGCTSGEVSRFSLPEDSGASRDFRAALLGEGRGFKPGAREIQSPEELVFLVERTPCAIGYSSLIYVIERVKRACVDPEREEYTPTDYPNDCVYPEVRTAGDGSYPLTRPLVAVTRGKPEGAVKTYLEWILSDAGQCVLQGKGFAPARQVACG